MSFPSRNFISYTAKWDEASSQWGWSLFGDWHDVLNDTEFCYNYHNSIGLVLSSPPYGNDAISNTGRSVTTSDLMNEITMLLQAFVASNTWTQNCLAVFEIGPSYSNDVSPITDHAGGIANRVDDVWYLETLTYTRFGRNQHQQSSLIIFSIGYEPPLDDIHQSIRSLKTKLSQRHVYSAQDAMFGQRRYREVLRNPRIRDHIRNKHQISPGLVNDIVRCLGKGIIVDWYSGSNLVGAAASGCGFQWLATEKDPLQFLNQLARFEMFDYEHLLARVGEKGMLPRIKQISNVYRAWVSREFTHFLTGLAYEYDCKGSIKALTAYQSYSHSPTPKPAATAAHPHTTPSVTPKRRNILEAIAQHGEYRYMETLQDTRKVLITSRIQTLANVTAPTLYNAMRNEELLVREAAPDLQQNHGNPPVCWALTDKAITILENVKELV